MTGHLVVVASCKRWRVIPALLLLAAFTAGCSSIGPGTIARDRFDYDSAVGMSWKRTMLLNLVKLRHGDTPMFLDVASITNSYTLESQVNVGGALEAGFEPVEDSLVFHD